VCGQLQQTVSAMAYVFGVIFAAFVLVLPSEAHAHTYQASVSFNNIVSSLCWSYGLFYLGVAGAKVIKAMRLKKKDAGNAPLKNGAVFFLLSGIYLLVFPFIQQGLQGMTPELQGPYRVIFIPILIVTILAAPFFPWIMLIFSKKLQHLRKQGIKGLCLMPVVPAVFVGAIFLYLKVLFPLWAVIFLR